MKRYTKAPNRLLPVLAASLLLLADCFWWAPAQAASLTTSYIRLNRMATGTATTFRIQFKATSSGATSVAINFNGADTTTWTGSGGLLGAQASQTDSGTTCATETGDTALPGGSHTFTVATSTLTINAVTALTAGTTYCDDLTFASAVSTPTSAGEYHPTITAGSDSTTVAVRIITNDQVVISAIVPPTFNFVLSGNSDSFTTNLASGSVVSTTGITATVNTNAKTGWIAWAKDSSTGLSSTAVSKTIASTTPGTTATLSSGSEGYVFGVTTISQGSGAGVTSALTAYDATASGGVNNVGSGLDSTLREIATSTGTASTAVITLKSRASISSLTPAATDYTDTITLIGAGKF